MTDPRTEALLHAQIDSIDRFTYALGGMDGVSVWGPPAGHDGYRQRNIAWTRQRMEALKADRVLARREGMTREVEVIDGWLDTYRHSLGDVA